MRASTVVAILCLAAEVSLFVALPLPASKFERDGVRPRGGRRYKVAFKPIQTQTPAEISGQPTGTHNLWNVKFMPQYEPKPPEEGPPLHQPLDSIPPASHPPGPHPDQQTIIPPQPHSAKRPTSPLPDTPLQPPPGSPSRAIALPKLHDALRQINPRPDTPLQSPPGLPPHQPVSLQPQPAPQPQENTVPPQRSRPTRPWELT